MNAFRLAGSFIVLSRFPVKTCSHCGGETLDRETTELMRVMLHSDAQPIKSISVVVFSCESDDASLSS
jgi:hypothetical protein